MPPSSPSRPPMHDGGGSGGEAVDLDLDRDIRHEQRRIHAAKTRQPTATAAAVVRAAALGAAAAPTAATRSSSTRQQQRQSHHPCAEPPPPPPPPPNPAAAIQARQPTLSNHTSKLTALSTSLATFSSGLERDASEVRKWMEGGGKGTSTSANLSEAELRRHADRAQSFLDEQRRRVERTESALLDVAEGLLGPPASGGGGEEVGGNGGAGGSSATEEVLSTAELVDLCRSLYEVSDRVLRTVEGRLVDRGYRPPPERFDDGDGDRYGGGAEQLLHASAVAGDSFDQANGAAGGLNASCGAEPAARLHLDGMEGVTMGVRRRPLSMLPEADDETDGTASLRTSRGRSSASVGGRASASAMSPASPVASTATPDGHGHVPRTPATPATPTLDILHLSNYTAAALTDSFCAESPIPVSEPRNFVGERIKGAALETAENGESGDRPFDEPLVERESLFDDDASNVMESNLYQRENEEHIPNNNDHPSSATTVQIIVDGADTIDQKVDETEPQETCDDTYSYLLDDDPVYDETNADMTVSTVVGERKLAQMMLVKNDAVTGAGNPDENAEKMNTVCESFQDGNIDEGREASRIGGTESNEPGRLQSPEPILSETNVHGSAGSQRSRSTRQTPRQTPVLDRYVVEIGGDGRECKVTPVDGGNSSSGRRRRERPSPSAVLSPNAILAAAPSDEDMSHFNNNEEGEPRHLKPAGTGPDRVLEEEDSVGNIASEAIDSSRSNRDQSDHSTSDKQRLNGRCTITSENAAIAGKRDEVVAEREYFPINVQDLPDKQKNASREINLDSTKPSDAPYDDHTGPSSPRKEPITPVARTIEFAAPTTASHHDESDSSSVASNDSADEKLNPITPKPPAEAKKSLKFRTPLAAAWIEKHMPEEKTRLFAILSPPPRLGDEEANGDKPRSSARSASRPQSARSAELGSVGDVSVGGSNQLSAVSSPIEHPKEHFIRYLTKEEYEAAPRVVKKQVNIQDVNAASRALDEWFQEHFKQVASEKPVTPDIMESDAYGVLRSLCNDDERKCKGLLMSLCHWRRLMMRIDHPSADGIGSKRFLVCQ